MPDYFGAKKDFPKKIENDAKIVVTSFWRESRHHFFVTHDAFSDGCDLFATACGSREILLNESRKEVAYAKHSHSSFLP